MACGRKSTTTEKKWPRSRSPRWTPCAPGATPPRVRDALARLKAAAAADTNLMPILVETVKAYATVGEICEVLRGVFGEYQVAKVY